MKPLRNRRLPLLLALLGLTVGSGCMPAWRRPAAESLENVTARGQLIIHSADPLPEHHRLLDELIAQRGTLLEELALPSSDEPIYVYLFKTPVDFRDFVQNRHPQFPDRRAFFVEGDTRLAIYAQWGDRVAEDLRHEVAHGYLHSVVPNLPLWLDEGLAEFFEVPRGADGLNETHLEHLIAERQSGWQPDLARLEQLRSPGDMQQVDYAESWAWVHLMLRTMPERREVIQRFLAHLRRDGTVEPLSPQLQRAMGDPQRVLLEHLDKLSTQR